jgi:hypothetical protein
LRPAHCRFAVSRNVLGVTTWDERFHRAENPIARLQVRDIFTDSNYLARIFLT